MIALPRLLALFSPDLLIGCVKVVDYFFKEIEKDFSKHIALLREKIVALFDPVLEKHLVRYEPRAGGASVKKFCRQMVKFHDNLVNILPLDQVVSLLLEIHVKFKKHLKHNLERRKIYQDGSPEYILVLQDLQTYRGTVGKLEALGMEATGVNDVWPVKPETRSSVQLSEYSIN